MPVSCKAMRSRSPLALRELEPPGSALHAQLTRARWGRHPRSGDVSENRGIMRGISERGGCECEMLRGKRLSGGREQQRNYRMAWHGSG